MYVFYGSMAVFSCWQKLPEERPSIKEIRKLLHILCRVVLLASVVCCTIKEMFIVVLFFKVFKVIQNLFSCKPNVV